MHTVRKPMQHFAKQSQASEAKLGAVAASTRPGSPLADVASARWVSICLCFFALSRLS